MISEETLARLFWTKFKNTKVVEIKVIPAGFKNTSYFIEDEKGERFVLKIYATNFLADEIIYTDTDIVRYLHKNMVPVIEIIEGLDGKRLQILEDGGKRLQATCSVFAETGMFKADQLNRNKVRSIARELGKLHRILSQYKLKSGIRTLTPVETLEEMKTKQTVEKIRDYFEENRNKRKYVEKFIGGYLGECEEQIKYFSGVLNNGLLSQLIHGDFNLSNITFDDQDHISTIFDFDEVTLAPVSFEIGCTLVHLDEGFMLLEDLVEYFTKEYRRHNKAFDERHLDASLMFMRYRALYRISRYFTYYRFSGKSVEHYTKYQYKLERYQKFSLV